MQNLHISFSGIRTRDLSAFSRNPILSPWRDAKDLECPLYFATLCTNCEEEQRLLDYLRTKNPSSLNKWNLKENAFDVINHLSEGLDGDFVHQVLQGLGLIVNNLFHGTNSQALVGIEKQGLSIALREYEGEIQDLRQRLNLYIHESPLNDMFGLTRSCEGKVYLTYDPNIALDYAKSSPEWFDLTSGKAKSQNDFSLASKKWNPLLSQNNVPTSLREELMSFLEKYWNIYKDVKPILIGVDPSSYYQSKNLDYREYLLKFLTTYDSNIQANVKNFNASLYSKEDLLRYLKEYSSHESIKAAFTSTFKYGVAKEFQDYGAEYTFQPNSLTLITIKNQ